MQTHLAVVISLFLACNQGTQNYSEAPEDIDSLDLVVIQDSIMDEGQTFPAIKTIEYIFYSYVESEDHTDSEDNKKAIAKALEECDTSLSISDLIVILNVWMYYDPVDFSTNDLTEAVLRRNQENAILAIDERIKNRMEWEDESTAPYSDLMLLKQKLFKD